MTDSSNPIKGTPSIFILSGGVGASGEQVVRTVLAQYADSPVSLQIFPKITREDQVQELLQEAAEHKAIVVHTFVNAQLRQLVAEQARQYELTAIDLFGSLMDELTMQLGHSPQGTPGLYRQLHQSYFDRIDAINFTLAHDDGKNPEGWKDAEIILVGASRLGKTPLSLYLSILGWKVANVPLIPELPVPKQLLDVDKRRVIGLTIDPTELLHHRKHRQEALGVSMISSYTDPVKIYEEVDAFEQLIRKYGFRCVDVTNKPLETSADEILHLIKRRLNLSSPKGTQ